MHFKWEQAFTKAMVSCVAVLGLTTNPNAADAGEKKPHFAFSYPKDLCLVSPRDFYFYIEGLAFQGMETNLDLVGIQNNATTSKIEGFDWGYSFGTRVGLGIYIDPDAWNVDVNWMWINVTNSKSYAAPTSGGYARPLIDDYFTHNSYKGTSGGGIWQSTFNVLDAALGKPYYISRKVTFNPHFGLRFSFIDQQLLLNSAGFASTSGSTSYLSAKTKIKNDFFGLGPRVGVNTDWALGRGFKLFSNLSTSILAGWFDNSYKSTLNGNAQYFTFGSSSVNKLNNSFQLIVPNLEINLGLDWGTFVGKDHYFFDVRAGYEFQIWWNQWNQQAAYAYFESGKSGNGDLTLNGFTLRVQLDM